MLLNASPYNKCVTNLTFILSYVTYLTTHLLIWVGYLYLINLINLINVTNSINSINSINIHTHINILYNSIYISLFPFFIIFLFLYFLFFVFDIFYISSFFISVKRFATHTICHLKYAFLKTLKTL